MAAMQGLQSDLFGGVDEARTAVAAPPMLAAQRWQMPEAEAFVAALRRGALNDAVAVLNRLKIDTAWKVLLETGFQVGGTTSRAVMMAPAQRDIIEAAQQRMTGHELRAAKVVSPEILGAVAERFGVPESVVAELASVAPEILVARYAADNAIIPNRMNPAEFERFPVGTVRIADFGGDFRGRYVEHLREFDPATLVNAEAEDGVKRHETYARYLAWAREGREAPYVSVYETDSGTLQSVNRRRTLVAQEIGKPIKGWFGPMNRETGNSLKYGDVLSAIQDATLAISRRDMVQPATVAVESVTIDALNRELASLENIDPFSPQFDRIREVRKLLAEGLARELPDGVVLGKLHGTGMRQGVMISREPDNSGNWRVSWFDERGFSGDGKRDSYQAAILDALSEGFRDTNRGLLDELSTLESFHAGNAATVVIREENERQGQAALERQTIHRLAARWAAVDAISGRGKAVDYDAAGITFVGDGRTKEVVKDGVTIGAVEGRFSRHALHDNLIVGIQDDAKVIADILEKEYQRLEIPSGYAFTFDPKSSIQSIATMHHKQFSARVFLHGEGAENVEDQVDTELRVTFNEDPRAILFMDKGQRWAYKNHSVLNDSERFPKDAIFSGLARTLVDTFNAKIREHLPAIETTPLSALTMHANGDFALNPVAVSQAAELAGVEHESVETSSWHTALPDAGLEIEDADETGVGYRQVGSRIARDAVNAVTQNQTMNGGTMFAYVMPAANGYHGRVRLLPEDQLAPDGWALLDQEGIRVGYLTKDQQIARITDLLGRAPVIGSRAAAPAKTAEEAIRKTFRALPDKTVGKVQPMTVTFDGVSRDMLAYANSPPSLANQQRGLHTPIHFSTVTVGRLAAGDPIHAIVTTFTLDGRDKLKENDRARYATAEDLKQWMDAGFANPMQGQAAMRTAYVPVTDDSHPAPIPRVSLSGLSDADRTKWVDLHRQQHELQYKDLRKVQKDMEAVRTPMHKAETRYKEMLAGAENAADALKKGLPGGERHDDYVIAANTAAEEFSRHSNKLEVLQFKHGDLFNRIHGLGRAKDAILPDSGDLRRDLASGKLRNDVEEAMYAKEQGAKYMKVRQQSSKVSRDDVTAVASAGDALPVIPEHVKQHLALLLAPARDTAAALARARQTDVQFHGEGRYAAETWLDRKDSIATMNDRVKDTLEGIPDMANRETARKYLAENMPDVSLTAQEKGYFRETAKEAIPPVFSAPVSMELLVKVAADSIGELRKVDVLRVLESNHRNVELAQYIAKERPDLAKEVDEVMVEEFGIRGWKGNQDKPILVTADMLVTKGQYVGAVTKVTDQHVIQDVGRGKLVAHERAAFDVAPVVDAMMTVGYTGGRVAAASVVGPASVERGR